jgi:hypothetical protein
MPATQTNSCSDLPINDATPLYGCRSCHHILGWDVPFRVKCQSCGELFTMDYADSRWPETVAFLAKEESRG